MVSGCAKKNVIFIEERQEFNVYGWNSNVCWSLVASIQTKITQVGRLLILNPSNGKRIPTNKCNIHTNETCIPMSTRIHRFKAIFVICFHIFSHWIQLFNHYISLTSLKKTKELQEQTSNLFSKLYVTASLYHPDFLDIFFPKISRFRASYHHIFRGTIAAVQPLPGFVHFKPGERVIIQGKVRRARQWHLGKAEKLATPVSMDEHGGSSLWLWHSQFAMV